MHAILALLLIGSDVDWTAYGRDPGGTRYSPVAQITRQNVAQLKPAWEYHTGALTPKSDLNSKAAFEATPILVDGTLYLSTPFNQVIALDPVTGKRALEVRSRCRSHPRLLRSDFARRVQPGSIRSARRVTPCRRRIIVGTIDARLIAVDAAHRQGLRRLRRTGVDLTQGVGLKRPRAIIRSPRRPRSWATW